MFRFFYFTFLCIAITLLYIPITLLTFCVIITYLVVKTQQYFVTSSCMFLDEKTVLEIWLNPGLNLTIFREPGPELHRKPNLKKWIFVILGVPSAYQQKRIKELNSTLHREQLEVLQIKDRMIMVNVLKCRLLKFTSCLRRVTYALCGSEVRTVLFNESKSYIQKN